MRARIPVLSAGRRRPSGLSRNKSLSAAEEEPRVPLLLLQDMNLCYRLLRHLVPGLPPERAASRVEILQHVIDYILDLETELDSCPARDPGEPQRGELHLCDRQQQLLRRPQSGQSPVVNIQSSESFFLALSPVTSPERRTQCITMVTGAAQVCGRRRVGPREDSVFTETRLFHLDPASVRTDPHQSHQGVEESAAKTWTSAQSHHLID